MSQPTKPKEKSQSPKAKAKAKDSAVSNPDVVYLPKDKGKKYPLQKNDLDNVIVLQFTKEKIRDQEFEVPANHMNPIGMYTPEEFEQHKAKGGLFERMKLLYDVWHTPEETEADDDTNEDDNKDDDPDKKD